MTYYDWGKTYDCHKFEAIIPGKPKDAKKEIRVILVSQGIKLSHLQALWEIGNRLLVSH
jgi:hypothetical protein